MPVLDTLAQFYVWSWIATISALLLPLMILLVRDARQPGQMADRLLDVDFQASFFARMLYCLGIDPLRYQRNVRRVALIEQLDTCAGCERRHQCTTDLDAGKPKLAACANAEPIARYLAARGMPVHLHMAMRDTR